MYSESGGGFVKPETVKSPASGAMRLIGFCAVFGLKLGVALISMIFLIRIHQVVHELMQNIAHLRLAHFH